VDGQTLTSPLKVVADPEDTVPQSDLETQLAFGLRVRDDISRLTSAVNQLRSVREQLQSRARVLEGRRSDAQVSSLLDASAQATKKADDIEARLHNPTAEVVYDILAMRGGTRLYSRLAPLLMWSLNAEAPPTAGMLQVLEEQEKELAALETESKAFVSGDVAAINAQASKLGLAFVIVP